MSLLCKNTILSQVEVSIKYPLDSIEFLSSLYLLNILFSLFRWSQALPLLSLAYFFLSLLGPPTRKVWLALIRACFSAPCHGALRHLIPCKKNSCPRQTHIIIHCPHSGCPSPELLAPQRKPCGAHRTPDICLPHFFLSSPLHPPPPPLNSLDPFLW